MFSYLPLANPSLSYRSSQSAVRWLIWFLGILAFSILISVLMISQGPGWSVLAWVLYITGVGLILYNPRAGLYLIISLGLMGDATVSAWFPFAKNFSSRESILFIHDAVIISPLETFLVITLISWVIRGISKRELPIYRGNLFFPALVFLVFVVIGLIYGIRTGGVLNIALWEARPLFYLVIVIFLISNLLEKREHVIYLIWFAMIGIFIEGIFGNIFIFRTLGGNVAGVNAITEHPAAVHMSSMIVFLLSIWMYKTSFKKRFTLLAMLPVVLILYFANQRRAAFITLGLALIIIAIILYKENYIAFWIIIPLAAVIIAAYMLVFWNVSGPAGVPAQAIKSVVVPSRASSRDQSSNEYRDIENLNLNFTIRQKPLTGIGFGQKFYVIVPLPDISFFEWWQYFPHNSIMWIWLKTGLFGFISMLFLVGYSIMNGAQTVMRMPKNELRAVALTATIYLIMHFVFAYVDIGWDTQSMLFVGAMMGVLNRLDYIAAQPIPPKVKRWHWQSEHQRD